MIFKLKTLKEKGYYTDKLGNIYSKNKKIFSRKHKSENKFTARVDGRRETISVHRYVGYLKYGKRIFDSDVVIYHKNGNVSDNSWDNILLGTRSDAMMSKPEEERIERANKAAAAQRKFSDKDVLDIVTERQKGTSLSKIAEKYNSKKSSISYLLNNSTYGKKIIADMKMEK